MPYQPIENLEIKSYGCIRDASVTLTPLHALIGPNDSGKSTILRALRTACQFAAGDFGVDSATPFDPMIDARTRGTIISLSYMLRSSDARSAVYLLENENGVKETVFADGEVVASKPGRSWNHQGVLYRPGKPKLSLLREYMTVATMVRFAPDCLRAPAPLLAERQGTTFADERGTGLASVFDAIVGRDVRAFTQIEADAIKLFPSISKIGLINTTNALKEIAVTLVSGERIGASAMSEGLLYYLGFAALKHITDSRLFLVEEPENGLHPARIAEIVSVLREISKTSQVVMATHSPLVINELEGHEVTVVTRTPEAGTKTVLLKDVPGFEDGMKVYQPGEFWLAYADGEREEPLLTGTPRP